MTKTLEALEKFAQALPPTPLCPGTPQAQDDSRCAAAPYSALPAGSAKQPFALPHALRATAKAEATKKRREASVKGEGLTRRGSFGPWPRLIGLVVLAVTIGVGFKLLVRASERAGEACWREGVGKSFAHSHPSVPSHHPTDLPAR